MYVVGSLVCVDGLKVHGVADHMVLIGDAVASEHVSGSARDLDGLCARVAFDHGDHLRRNFARVLQSAHLQTRLNMRKRKEKKRKEKKRKEKKRKEKKLAMMMR